MLDYQIEEASKRDTQRKEQIEVELNQAFGRNNYKMSTTTKKRDAKKRTKTLEDELLVENKCKKSSMPLPKVRKLTTVKTQESNNTSQKCRRRKTADEINLLERCFIKDSEWNQETVDYIKNNSHLNYVQIYKWGWDQKKKIEKNPHLKNVPTIDEFGGYCKFDSSNIQLDQLCTEDLNEKVRIIVLEIEKETGPLPDNKPIEKSIKRRKTDDFDDFDNFDNFDTNIFKGSDKISSVEEENFFSPPKKLRRERYCSDLTNVTRSNALKISVADRYVNPFIDEDDDVSSMKMGNFNFDSNDFVLDYQSMKCFGSDPNYFFMEGEKLSEEENDLNFRLQ